MWDLCCSCDPICKSQRVELIGIVTPNLLVSVQHWNRYHNRGASRTSSLSRSCHSGYTLSKNIVHLVHGESWGEHPTMPHPICAFHQHQPFAEH
uniref:Uncharacterized protein n=2 Tax=Oryza TaxID=4527 RepID=A0A0D9Z7X6_9ORYZ